MKIFLLIVSLAATTLTFATDLTPEEIQKVKDGKDIVKTEEVSGAPLPRIRVYTFVKAPVDVIEQVFRDYENSHTYVPGVIKATVVSRPNPDTYIVETSNKIAVVGVAKTTLKKVYRKDGDTVIVDWTLIESDQAEESTGRLSAEPLEGGCIMCYTNFMKPKITLGVNLLKNVALKEVEKNVTALKAESEKRAQNAK